MMIKNTKLVFRRKSFTLIELLIAVFVLEIGLMGIAGFYSYSLTVAKIAREETTAANLASGVMDEELALGYNNVTNVTKINFPSPFDTYQKQVDIVCIDNFLATQTCNTTTHMKKITVTVFWPYQSGERSFQMATIKAEN